ncbi:hypothetical protein, partial [Pseudophaeobacter arcticus]|uniref:hypothetical protein n=1 Tax=Pseudophaeobacter arcticus TaxID=385492 RepID=UPI00333F3DD0
LPNLDFFLGLTQRPDIVGCWKTKWRVSFTQRVFMRPVRRRNTGLIISQAICLGGSNLSVFLNLGTSVSSPLF